MKTNIALTRNLEFFIKKTFIIIAILMYSISSFTQDITLPLSTGNPIDIYIGNTICEPSSATVFSSQVFDNLIFTPIFDSNLSQNAATHHTMIAGQTTTVVVEVPYAGQLIANNENGIPFAFGESGFVAVNTLMSQPFVWGPNGGMAFELPIKFEKGTKKGYVTFKIFDGDVNDGTNIGNWVTIPISVEGPTQSAVAIIDTIVEPQIPYLVLHAPPGGGSSSEFQTIETTCREFNTNFAEEGSHSANLAVKLGVKGSIGFINTIDYEFSVTMSAGFETGDMSIVSNSKQTCISVAEGFSTEALTDNEGGGDVFIGYGTDLVLGLYEYFTVDESTCTVVMDTGLIYAPTGDPRKFIYTKEAIETEIEELGDIVADSLNNNPRVSNNAQNQINVWNQVISMNTDNVNNPNNELIENLSFSNNTTATSESSISIVETNTIEYEHFISGSVGLEAKLEIGGSGITGGYEYKGSKRFGESNNASSETSKMLKYSLTDDSEGDKFDLEIVRDPMYGTPIFRVEPSSKTSCPYQGGYQRDQPLLTFLDGESEYILENIPLGSTGTFQVKICNDSDEDRTYYLKGNPNTNLNGAIIEGFGNNLFNTNDQGIEFSVPANDCLDAATLSIKQASSNIQDYEDIEIYLNVDCQPASAPITSSIFLSAHFSESTAVSDLDKDNNSMSIIPNPNNGQFSIDLEAAVDQGQIMMTDITGKTVYHQNIKKGDTSVQINQNDIEPGIYIIVLQDGAQVSTQKVVVNR